MERVTLHDLVREITLRRCLKWLGIGIAAAFGITLVEAGIVYSFNGYVYLDVFWLIFAIQLAIVVGSFAFAGVLVVISLWPWGKQFLQGTTVGMIPVIFAQVYWPGWIDTDGILHGRALMFALVLGALWATVHVLYGISRRSPHA